MLIGYTRVSTHEQTLALQQDALQKAGCSKLFTDLEERGIGFKSLTENIDTTTSGGKLIFHIFGALAEFERNLIRELTQAGLSAARARGRKGGRPKALTGRQLSIAQDLYDRQHPIAEILQTLKISKATLYRSIKTRERHPQS
jgi:DNA invertase Pin-like site-specific DNA recombinase